MPPLSDELRGKLEKAVVAARDVAEAGAADALQRLYVPTVDSKALPDAFAPNCANCASSSAPTPARSATTSRTRASSGSTVSSANALRALAPHALRPLPGRERASCSIPSLGCR